MTLVILAAGMGSRYGGLKQLDPMTENGEFIIDFSIYDAIRAGFDRVVFIIKRENYELFRETVGARVEKRIKVEYAFQDINDIPSGACVPTGRVKPWGTTHAVLATRHIVKDNFAVINADDFYGKEAFAALYDHLKDASEENGVNHSCMIGYVLKNTLTENGTVTRGICKADEDKLLVSIKETSGLRYDGDMAAYNDGDETKRVSYETLVSMNCWGFTPGVFNHLEQSFEEFMSVEHKDPLKSECMLPNSVMEMMEKGVCDVKVYSCNALWYGVTYKEDKEYVKNSIKGLIDKGEYPAPLWK